MEVSQLSTHQENVHYGQASLPTFAHLVPDTGHAPIKEEVFETDLLGSKLDKERASLLAQATEEL